MATEEQKKDNKNEEPLEPEAIDAKSIKKRKIKKLAIILTPLLIVCIAGSVYYFKVIKPKPTLETNAHNAKHESDKVENKEQLEIKQNTYLDLGQMTIGLSPSGKKREFLRIALTLRLANIEETEAVLSKAPIIKDNLITFLRSLRSTDFNNSSSTIYLKEEITKRINNIISPIEIREVLFQEMQVS